MATPSGAPAREPQTEACLDNTSAAHRLHGRPQTVENIQRPKITGANLSFRIQDKLMANPAAADPVHYLLKRVIESNEQRRLHHDNYIRALTASMQRIIQSNEELRLRRNDYSRALTAAMQNMRRAVEREQHQLWLVEQAYSMDVTRVVMQNKIYVHNMDELEALMQAVELAERPFSLQRVTVQNPDPDMTEEIMVYLENVGFAAVEENNTFTLPPHAA